MYIVLTNASGELSISAFSHIVSDPRVAGIPLILETPAFDGPGSALAEGMEIWQKEVEVLHRIGDAPKRGGDAELEEWAEEIQVVVGEMKSKKDAKEKEKKGRTQGRSAGGKVKKRRKVEDDEGEDSCDSHDDE